MAKPPMFPSQPSPQDLHNAVTIQLSKSNYFSITTAKQPWAPWYTLPTNQNMETRPCHHSGSRVHKLTCGHVVAMPRDSESCSANCISLAPNPDPNMPTQTPHSAANQPTISKIRTSISEALCYRQAMLREADDPAPEMEFEHHKRVLDEIWNKQDARLRPAVDLVGGNFACQLCDTPGLRKTRPAFILDQAPYCCVVVGYGHRDTAIIRQLDRGILPQPPPLVLYPMQNRGGSIRGGGGGRGGGYARSRRGYYPAHHLQRIKDARITKSRVAEKNTVLARMMEEEMMEELETLWV